MPKKIINLTTFTAAILILSTLAVVNGQSEHPEPPHRFKGYVIDENGELAADNTTVSAKIDNIFYNTTVKNGTYGFTTETEEFQVHGSDRDVIHFYINGTYTQQTVAWELGGLNVGFAPYLNLTLDNSSLVITLVTSSDITTSQAVITWTTDKSANSTVHYGTTINLGLTNHDSNFVTDHIITLSGLQSSTKYYYEVISYDRSGHMAKDNNSGEYYSFMTETYTGGDTDDDDDTGDDDDDYTPSTNQAPTADADGPYHGMMDQTLYFDASKSNDTDGYIVSYDWDLGDGTTISTQNVRISHVYSKVGNYTITLTVTDDDGATNSTATFAYISTNDSDGDGWSDDAESYYGTDPHNASDYPHDNDNDGIPDSVDPDDDNDDLTDDEEDNLGTNSNNNSDVIRILNDYGLFFLIDINGDGIIDRYYNRTTGIATELHKTEEGTFLIDVNGDNKYDYIYDLALGDITPYQKAEDIQESDDNLVYIFIILVIIAVVILLVAYFKFKRGEK